MPRIRSAAAVIALVVAAPTLALLSASPAQASCAAPELRLAKDQRVLESGTELTVRGRYFVAGCDDTPPPEGEAYEPSPGRDDVPLRLRQDGEAITLGRADAGGPASDRYGRIRWAVEVPGGVKAGAARLEAPGAAPIRVRIAPSPSTAYVAVTAAIRARDVEAFRGLRAWRGAGAEVRRKGCRYGTQRPRHIVNCLADAAEEERLRLPDSPDRTLSVRQIVRRDHPQYGPERRRREVRGLTREVSETIGRRVRPRAIATAQVDQPGRPDTPLDVYVVRVRGEWQLFWMETRTRIDERR